MIKIQIFICEVAQWSCESPQRSFLPSSSPLLGVLQGLDQMKHTSHIDVLFTSYVNNSLHYYALEYAAVGQNGINQKVKCSIKCGRIQNIF